MIIATATAIFLLLSSCCCIRACAKLYDLNGFALQEKDLTAVYGMKETQRRMEEEDIFAHDNKKSVFHFATDYEKGTNSCPCLTPESPFIDAVNASDQSIKFLGANFTLDTYGFGCAKHDKPSQYCLNGCPQFSTITPPPIDCDNSWCERNWCYVDPNNCQLLSKRSTLFPTTNRFFSYSTCWDMDDFTRNARLGSLAGRVLRAGYNSNSGGWLGAYSSAKEQFKGPLSRWTGPAVSFIREAAMIGNFLVNMTDPPEFLREHSLEYFGTSSFDYCIYATALGYLDFCVAQYTVTDQRASTTDWLLLGSQDILLVVDLSSSDVSGFDKFLSSTQTIFNPFTKSAWMFIIFLVIPLLGGLMVVHEYGHAGSGFPKMETIVEIDDTKGGKHEIRERKVPLYRHIVRSLYIGYLSVLQQTYSQSVVTYGAMLNLLGISFFILSIISVYTANLAAILTQEVEPDTLTNIEEVVAKGWKICSERKTMEIVRSLYTNISDATFVVDPPSLDGDGKPGFICTKCEPRKRVFDFLDPVKADKDPLYCHAAIAPLEDLEVFHQNSEYCALSPVGDVVGQVQTGMPVFEGISAEFISLLLKLKNDGVYDKELTAARPESQCPVVARGEGSALTIQQLTGIWVVSFGIAFVGILVTFFMPRIERIRKKHVHPVMGYDQTGQSINMLENGDSWIHNKTIMMGEKKIFVGDDSKLGSRNNSVRGDDTEDLDAPANNGFNLTNNRMDDSQNSKGTFPYLIKPSRYSTLNEPDFEDD